MANWIDQEDKALTESEALSNGQIIANHFKKWTPQAISAMLGNMWVESSVNPNRWALNNPNHERNHGFGLVQWRMGVLKDWADSKGLDFKKGDTQLKRIDYELANGGQWYAVAPYNMTFKEFTQSKESVQYLTEVFIWSYERPNQSAGEQSLPARKAFARKAAAELDFSGKGGIVEFIFPLDDPYRITQEYKGAAHWGIDVAGAVPGAHVDIHAVADGTVTRSYLSDTYGEVIFIQHKVASGTYESVCAHMTKRNFKEGDKVKQGAVLGQTGETGAADGVHLHFELHKPSWNDKKSNAVDPMDYLGQSTGGEDGGSNDPGKKKKSLLIYQMRQTNMRRRHS